MNTEPLPLPEELFKKLYTVSKDKKHNSSPCWLMKTKNLTVTWAGQSVRAYRQTYYYKHGSMPISLMIRDCAEERCINPDHYTQPSDVPVEERNFKYPIRVEDDQTFGNIGPEEAMEIYQEYNRFGETRPQTATVEALAEQYGVTPYVIRCITNQREKRLPDHLKVVMDLTPRPRRIRKWWKRVD